jgi:pimeloyl-ACP methyl ester carboxylesterase
MARVEMVAGSIRHEGRRLRFGVSSNATTHHVKNHPGEPEPLWAINVHGYFAGGEMYWRESEILAARLGWRIVNPSLPGFGGSQPLPWDKLSLPALADTVATVLDHFGVERAIVLGHSMGGAVAVAFADRHPDRTLGIIYRDGAATPRWRDRRGVLPALLAPLVPDLAGPADMVLAAVLDVPDILLGRTGNTIASLVPDVRRNIRTVGRTAPAAALLMTIDLREEVERLGAAKEIPLLAEWGCFDRIAHEWTAEEFSECAGVPVHWVPGGHSWMLARPRSQADVLTVLDWGQEFVGQVESRAERLAARTPPR